MRYKFELLRKCLLRFYRMSIGKKGIYGIYGKNNHFSERVIAYENSCIGSNNYFAPGTLINNCKIGNFCSIGPYCCLGLANHKLDSVSTYPAINNGSGRMELFDLNRPTIIENDVWLGANVVIKQGVKISNGAVIGSGSVVTKDVPPYAIVTGIPGKIRGYRFDNGTIKKLLDSKWFENEFEPAVIKVNSIRKENHL